MRHREIIPTEDHQIGDQNRRVAAQINLRQGHWAFGGGNVHIGDCYEGNRHSNDHDPADDLVIGWGVGRVLAVLGALAMFAGFGGLARGSCVKTASVTAEGPVTVRARWRPL